MLPLKTDSRLTTFAANSYLTQLLEAGVKIYQYTDGFLHSKLLLVDDQIATIGSANMDFRSLEHNFEISGIIYDSGTAKRLHTLFRPRQDLLPPPNLRGVGAAWANGPLCRILLCASLLPSYRDLHLLHQDIRLTPDFEESALYHLIYLCSAC